VKKLNIFLILIGTLIIQDLYGYALPAVNLGFTNILDGGPVRPKPGFYIYEYFQYYYSNKFLDSTGHLLDGVPSPTYNSYAIVNQFIYQTKENVLLKAKGGIDLVLPIVLSSTISKNILNITNSGAGFGDFDLGIYLQWDTIYRKGRPFFANRLNFNASFPTGQFLSNKSINPGAGFFWIDPYWAATFYFTEKASVSWRLHYLWCAKNPTNQVSPGTAIHCNFSFEYEVINNFYLALVGYVLQQLNNTKKDNVVVPNSKERVLGIGPGALYMNSEDLMFFGYLYFEMDVRNRPQGISLILRLLKHF